MKLSDILARADEPVWALGPLEPPMTLSAIIRYVTAGERIYLRAEIWADEVVVTQELLDTMGI